VYTFDRILSETQRRDDFEAALRRASARQRGVQVTAGAVMASVTRGALRGAARGFFVYGPGLFLAMLIGVTLLVRLLVAVGHAI